MTATMKTALVVTVMVIAACTSRTSPGAPSPTATAATTANSHAGHSETADKPANHNSAAHEDKGYIDGWVNGETVQLYYTKSYFCEEPPESAAASGCEIGANAEIAPRPGSIPTIYAIAAAGITPDPATLACAPGTQCLNHPLMIDASRVLGPGVVVGGVPHSHILTERRAGWHHTVNIRVRSLASWNQIAAAKTLDKVRELQADPAALVSADTPTNIFFFIASWR